jgi:hypothetical protein
MNLEVNQLKQKENNYLIAIFVKSVETAEKNKIINQKSLIGVRYLIRQ